MAEIGTVTARLRADVSQFNSGLQQAQGQVRSLGAAGDHGARGLHSIRGALLSLADQATGANPIIGRLSSAILAFGAGQKVTLAVVAGLAAIGVAYRLLTKDAEDSRKALVELGNELDKISAHGKMTAAQIRLDIAKESAQSASQQGDFGLRSVIDYWKEQWRLVTGGPPLINDVTTAQIALNAAAKEYQKFLEKHNEELVKLRQKADDVRRANEAAFPTGTTMGDIYARARLGLGGNVEGEATSRGTTTTSMIGPPQGYIQGGPTTWDPGPSLTKASAGIAKTMKELGVDAMAAFVTGILAGSAQFEDLLKSIFMAFLTAGITKVFHVLFKIGSPSGWAKDMGGYLAEGLAMGIESGTGRVGGASLRLASAVPSGFVGAARLSINPTLPASRSPFDVARDADWLRALGESARELGYRGFKFK